MTAAAYEMEIAVLRARVIELEGQLAGRRRSDAERQRRRRERIRHVTSYTPVGGVSRDRKSALLPITLGTRLEQPRCDFSIAEQPQDPIPGSGPLVLELIAVMNRTLGQTYSDYQPVRGDNYSSNETADELEAAGLDPAWAAAELRRQCVQFNRGKHGNGDLPRTLTYFRRGLLRAWSRHTDGGQFEMPLVSIDPPIVAQRGTVAPPQPIPAPVTVVFPRPAPAENNPVTSERLYQAGSFNWRAILEDPSPRARVA